jgi:pre-mRNA-splicing factor CWC26
VQEREREKTASGYVAGLQTGSEFSQVEQDLRAKHKAELSQLGEGNSGKGADTVYRDRRGRKLDMLNEFMRQQQHQSGQAAREEQQKYEWGMGTTQKEQAIRYKRELEDIAAQPFARKVEDMDEELKDEIRADDPMAAYMQKRKKEKRSSGGKRGVMGSARPAKPVYSGPAPLPNRFGIRPGYRWDGVDRSNQFEAKRLAAQRDQSSKSSAAYAQEMAGM